MAISAATSSSASSSSLQCSLHSRTPISRARSIEEQGHQLVVRTRPFRAERSMGIPAVSRGSVKDESQRTSASTRGNISHQSLQQIGFHKSNVPVPSPLWQAIAEDVPPPLPPRPQQQGAAPAPNVSLKLKSSFRRGSQRLKKAIGVCKSLPPTPPATVISPIADNRTNRRLSLPSADFDCRPPTRPLAARRGSDGELQLAKRRLPRRALPPEPIDANQQAQVAIRTAETTVNSRPGSWCACNTTPCRSASGSSSPDSTGHSRLQDPPSARSQSPCDTTRETMSAPPIAPRPAHTLTEKSSSGSSGYSSRGQSPAHHSASATSSDLSPEGPRRQCKESISLPISRTSSSDHLSPPFTYRRRGSQDSGTLSLEQSPTSHKGMKAGLRRMVGSLKRGSTTPKKKLHPDACLSPPTPDLTANCAWPTPSSAQSTASDEALIRAYRSAGGGHAPLQRCSAAGGTRPLMSHERSAMISSSHHSHGRRDPQVIGRAHSLPVHNVHSISHHHSQANRQLSGGHLDQQQQHAANVRKGFDYNAKYRAFDWFFGRMSREQAQRLLMDYGSAGDYLLRERDTCPGEYAISVKARQTVLHFRVYCDNHGYVCNKDASSCPTLIDLVRFHTTVPLTGNSSGSDGVFYLERSLNRAHVPASEGLPVITNRSSSSLNAGSCSISRQNSTDLQDINEELYLEPLPCSMTPSDSEVSKTDETEDDDDHSITLRRGVYIDEESPPVDARPRESVA